MRPTLSAAGACVITDCGSIPWDAERGRPIDHEGEAGRLYARALAEHGMTEPDPYVAPPLPPPGITKAQCLLWLHQLGVSEQDIDAFVERLPDDGTRETARIEWRHQPTFRADHPFILAAADEFGIPRDYLPDAFRAAALL